MDNPVISKHDSLILDMVFNTNSELALPPPSTSTSNGDEPAPNQNIHPTLLAQLKSREIEGVQLAESGKLTEALAVFDECLETCPTYASAFNNRAQVHRLRGDNDKALEDLNKAISVAGNDRAVLKQAYTQRGILHQLRNEEELALADFERGGRLGNPIAGSAAVSLNPYAKMCNAIVSEVLGAEMRKGWKERHGDVRVEKEGSE